MKITEEQISTCPICNNSKFITLFSCTDYTVSKETFLLIKCDSCSLVITSPRPTADSIGKYYESNDYVSHAQKSNSFFDKVYFAARKIALRNKRSLIAKYHTTGKLLDYGCGTGSFLTYMHQNNWQTFGIEPSDKARVAAQDSGVEIASNLEDLKQKDFDVITLWHVLEHIHDLNNKLSQLKMLTAEKGTIIIAVPNYESFDAEHYEHNWAAYDVPRHLWHFSQKSMKSLLTKHDLKLIDTVPMKMDSYYVSILSEKYQNRKRLKGAISGLLTGLKSNLRAANSNQYSSLIYIAQKE